MTTEVTRQDSGLLGDSCLERLSISDGVAGFAKERKASATSLSGLSNSDDKKSSDEKESDVRKQEAKLIPSMISMMVTLVGLGFFGLPLAFANAGILGGSFLVILGAIATNLGLIALVELQKRSGGDCYEDVGKYYLGTVGLAMVYFLVNLDLLMAAAQQLTPYAQFTKDVIILWSKCAPEEKVSDKGFMAMCFGNTECKHWNGCSITLIALAFGSFWLIKKSVDELKWASMASLISLLVATAIFIHYYFSWEVTKSAGKNQNDDEAIAYYDKKNYHDYFFPVHKTVKLWNPINGLAFIDSIGIVIFAYICFFQILLLYAALKHKKDVYPIIHVSTFGFAMVCYLFMGILGYCCFGEQLAVDGTVMIFKQMGLQHKLAQAAIFCIGITCALKIAIYLNPVRDAILQLVNTVGKKKSFQLSNSLNYRLGMAVILAFFSYFVALAVPFTPMMTIAGSITGGSLSGYMVGFLLLAYVKMYGLPSLEDETLTTNSWLLKFGILAPRTFNALTTKMKSWYMLAWFLIMYGFAATVLGMTPAILTNFYDAFPYKFPCCESDAAIKCFGCDGVKQGEWFWNIA